MSPSAVVLLIVTLLSLASLWLLPDLQGFSALVLKCAAGLGGLAFVLALLLGRRFKFDPVLR